MLQATQTYLPLIVDNVRCPEHSWTVAPGSSLPITPLVNLYMRVHELTASVLSSPSTFAKASLDDIWNHRNAFTPIRATVKPRVMFDLLVWNLSSYEWMILWETFSFFISRSIFRRQAGFFGLRDQPHVHELRFSRRHDSRRRGKALGGMLGRLESHQHWSRDRLDSLIYFKVCQYIHLNIRLFLFHSVIRVFLTILLHQSQTIAQQILC